MTFEEYVELCNKNKPEEKPKPTFAETYKGYDSVYTMDNTTVIVLYVIAMIIGTLFNDRIYVYIGATLLLIKHLNRHKK